MKRRPSKRMMRAFQKSLTERTLSGVEETESSTAEEQMLARKFKSLTELRRQASALSHEDETSIKRAHTVEVLDAQAMVFDDEESDETDASETSDDDNSHEATPVVAVSDATGPEVKGDW